MHNGIRIVDRFHYRKAVVFSLFVLLIFLTLTDPVLAHRVTIFAWIEGDTVYTQSKFSGGKRVMNSRVIVYDLKKNQLLEGKTDGKGEFSFKIPPQSSSGLRVVLHASMGHMAEWVIPADEMGNIKHEAEESVVASSDRWMQSNAGEQPPVSTGTPTGTQNRLEAGKNCNCQDIQDMIDRALDKKLTPMTDMLIASLDPKPTLRNIIGGLGYIMGLVGIVMYVMARKKEK